MARLHSKKKGKSGTKRPKGKIVPEWIPMEKAAVEEIILKMAGEGVPPSKIALFLRDQKGVANLRMVLGMSLSAFLKKNKAAPEYPEDLIELIRKAMRMNSHLRKSKKDLSNKVKLLYVESIINRLVKYYVSKGTLPGGCRYDLGKAALLVK